MEISHRTGSCSQSFTGRLKPALVQQQEKAASGPFPLLTAQASGLPQDRLPTMR